MTSTTPVITLINGPNLNLLGQRQPDVYGYETLADVERQCSSLASDLGLTVDCLQSNHEGVIVDAIQAARGVSAGIIINPGAYSHTSIAIMDALMAFEGPVLEVHVSNIHQRESFRHHSYVSLRANGVIAGCGVQGYSFAIQRLSTLISQDNSSAKPG